MAKHTPGPWKAVQHDRGWWTVLQGAWDISHNEASRPGVVASSKYSVMSIPENEANARLIAAAPELLEALKGAAMVIDACIRNSATVPVPGISRIMRAAIAKAEAGDGGTPGWGGE